MAKLNFGGVEENVVTREEFSLSKAQEVLKDEVIAIIGYGVQGPAQALNLKDNGFSVIIAGAGGAAHLPGMLAAKTTLPVLGVPVPSKYLKGMDSLLSIVQMPKGIPVATYAVGEAGAANAALSAISILAISDASLADKLAEFREKQQQSVFAMTLPPDGD